LNITKIFKERDPTQGSIIKNILGITSTFWPNSAYYILFTCLNLLWVSKLGPQAIAAVAIGGAAFMFLMMPVQGLATSAAVIIGQFAGQQDKNGLEKLVKELLATGWCLAIILALFGYFLAPTLLKLIGAEPEVLSLATTYLRIQAIGGIITFSFWIINGMVRAARGMRIIMKVMASMITLQIIFDYLLILGHLGFPRLGVAGASLSAVLSAGAGALMGYLALAKGKSLIKIDFKNWQDFRIRFKTLKEIIGIGGFNTLEGISLAIGRMVMLGIVAPFGTFALAAYEIGQRLLRITAMFVSDLGQTTLYAVSNNLGAGYTKRAENYGWDANILALFFMGIPAILFFIFAPQVIGIFTQYPETLQIGISYLRITTCLGLGYIFYGAGLILEKAFAGAKDTRTPFIVYLFTIGLQIGLALILPQVWGLGVSGIWWAILIAAIFNGSILAILFKKGIWRKEKKTA